jgi:hypothetical protein
MAQPLLVASFLRYEDYAWLHECNYSKSNPAANAKSGENGGLLKEQMAI